MHARGTREWDDELHELTHEIHAENIRTGRVNRYERNALERSHQQAIIMLPGLLDFAAEWDAQIAAEGNAQCI
jgi:hypothetical protein